MSVDNRRKKSNRRVLRVLLLTGNLPASTGLTSLFLLERNQNSAASKSFWCYLKPLGSRFPALLIPGFSFFIHNHRPWGGLAWVNCEFWTGSISASAVESPPGLEYFPLNPIMKSLPWEFLALNRDFVIAKTFSAIFTPYFKTLTTIYETEMKTTCSLLFWLKLWKPLLPLSRNRNVTRNLRGCV